VTELDHALHPVVVLPLERGLEARLELVIRVEPQVLPQVGRIILAEDDLSRIEDPVGIERRLEVLKGRPEFVAVAF